MYTSALSFVSGVWYTRRIYEEKEKAAANDRAKAAANDRAKAEEIAKK